MNPRLRPLIALLAGAAVAAGFAPLDLWPLAILGTGALCGLVASSASPRAAALEAWAWGLAMFSFSLSWIAKAFTYQAAMPAALGWVAVIGLSAFLALYPMLAGLGARLLTGPGPARLLAFAGLFLLTEWLRGWVLTGFAWNPLGAAWLGAPGVAQMAALAGAHGLSALMLLAGAALWLLAGPARTAAERGTGLALSLLLLVIGGIGASRVQEVYFPDNPSLVIVQPNIGQDEKYQPGANDRHLERYLQLTAQALSTSQPGGAIQRQTGPADPLSAATLPGFDGEAEGQVPTTITETLGSAGDDSRPRLVIWSEAAVFGLPEEDEGLRQRLAAPLGPRDLLIFGGTAVNRDAAGNVVTALNSLFVLDARGRLLARYDKAHLTPLGEYLPARPLMTRLGLARLAPGGIDFVPGPGPRTITLPGIPPFGAMICYEIIFGGRVTEHGRRPAFIVNISNDAWFGAAGPPQHLAQARLRAIEEGLPIARATPTGVSAVIGPRGSLFATQPAGTAGVLRFTLPPPLPATPYARNGNTIPLAIAALLLAAGLAASRLPSPPTASRRQPARADGRPA